MSFMQQHQLKITTLSPVHIGSNETYEPTNYVIDGETLYEFNAQQAIDALTEKERENLLRIVNGKSDESMLKSVQSFFYRHKDALMAMSTHFLPAGKGITDLYQSRIGKTAQHETGGRQVINKLEIERTAYNPMDRRPIFPGSSMKGAIRTALLDMLNQGRSLPHNLRNDRQANRKLQEQLLQGKFDTDPLRLLSIGDARWNSMDDLTGSEIRFAVNRRKKISEKDGRLVQSMAEQKGLYQLLECVMPMRCRALETTLNLHHPETVVKQKDKLPAFQWSVQDIAEACNAFYRPLFEKELQLIDSLGYADPSWVSEVENLLQQVDRNKCFLLRLGRHSGAESITLNGVRSIKIMKGRGEKPAWEPSAKTIWLAAPDTKSSSSMMPFGWVLVEIDPQSEASFAQVMQRHQQWLGSWQTKLEKQHQDKRAQLEQSKMAQAERDLKRMQDELRMKDEAEKKRQAAEEAKSNLSEMGAKFFDAAQLGDWAADKNVFSIAGMIEHWLDRLEKTADPDVISQLQKLLEIHFKGLLENPDKVKGKKKTAVYKDRMRQVAKRFNQLMQID